jgi:hypothetical protein
LKNHAKRNYRSDDELAEYQRFEEKDGEDEIGKPYDNEK